MIADYLNVTVPAHREYSVLRDLGDIAGLCGSSRESPELFIAPGGGTLKIRQQRSTWLNLSFSGAFLDRVRGCGLLSEALHSIGSDEHRVTRLDVAHDLFVESPPILRKLLAKGRRGSLRLSRKALKGKHVTFVDRSPLYETKHSRTGTVYLGSRKSHEVSARIYDKRNERIDRGFDDPGPVTRYELTVSGKLRPSLRDVFEPAPVFWNFMADILPKPHHSSPWVPAGDDLRLDPLPIRDPEEVLAAKVADSPEVEHLLDLARRIGPGGLDTLVQHLRLRDARDAAVDQIDFVEAPKALP